MQERVLKVIKKNNLIKSGESILIGLSGGPDSVCLLHILHLLSKILDIEIFACHVNHMLRGKESNSDEIFVKELCKSMGVKLFAVCLDIKGIAAKENLSIEEAARKGRYEYFSFLADKIGSCKVAVGHNKNDQAETVIMNIIRGTGLDGLRGMDYIRGNVIRPLLNEGRSEIEKYCKHHQLDYCIDSTNLKNIYTRNKIRLELLPYISQSFDINVIENIIRMSNLIRDDQSYLELVSTKLYYNSLLKENPPYIELDINKLSGYHKAVRKRVIRKAIEKARGNLKGIENVHIDTVVRLSLEGKTGSKIHLPKGVRVEKSYNILKIYVIEDFAHKKILIKEGFFEKILIPGTTTVNALNATLESVIIDRKFFKEDIFKSLKHFSFVQFFDYNKLSKEKIDLRSRKKGDILNPYKCKGTQKLKKFFIDNKIPREERDLIPLVAKGKEIIWIIGYKISDKFKITENTKSILRLEYRKN